MSENINLEELQRFGAALHASVEAAEVMEATLGTMKAASVAFVASPKSTSAMAQYIRSSMLLVAVAYVLGLHPKAAAASSKSVDTFAKGLTKVVKSLVGQPIPVPEGEEDKGLVYADVDTVWAYVHTLLRDTAEWKEETIADIPQHLLRLLTNTEKAERLTYADAKILASVKAIDAAIAALAADHKGKRFDEALALLTTRVSALVASATVVPSTPDTVLVSA